MEPSRYPQYEKGDTSNMEEFLNAIRDIQSINVDKIWPRLSQGSKHSYPFVSETLSQTSVRALEFQMEWLRKELEQEKAFKQEYFKVFGKKEMKDVNKTIDLMEDQIKKLQEENTKLHEKNKRLEEEMQKAITEKENAMTRFNQQMRSQVTNNTPNSADMSDQNQLYELRERYKNLYDTQWTDAFEVLTETNKQTEKMAVEILLKLLIECHNFAKIRSEKQMNELVRSISGDRSIQVGDAIKRQLKTARKLMDVEKAYLLFQECEIYVKDNVYFDRIFLYDTTMKKYLIECFQICWLMAIQDPPSVLGKELKYAEDFDTGMYKPYTTSGTRVDFVVLPPILLHEDGPVLEEGVAHSIQEKPEQIKTYRNAWDSGNTIGIRDQLIGGTSEQYRVKHSSTTTRPLTKNGRLNMNLPQTVTPCSSSFARTSYGMEMVDTSYKQNSPTNYGGPLSTIGSTSYANSNYSRQPENKVIQGQQGIRSYTGGANVKTEREAMNESKQSRQVPSPHASSARTSYESEKTSQLHNSTAKFDSEIQGHLSGPMAKPVHFDKRGTAQSYEPLKESEQDEFASFIYMYCHEGDSVTRPHFYTKYDRYLALYQELFPATFGGK